MSWLTSSNHHCFNAGSPDIAFYIDCDRRSQTAFAAYLWIYPLLKAESAISFYNLTASHDRILEVWVFLEMISSLIPLSDFITISSLMDVVWLMSIAERLQGTMVCPSAVACFVNGFHNLREPWEITYI